MIDPTTKPMIYVHDDGVVRSIVLNRPEKKNALTPEMMGMLLAEVRAASALVHATTHTTGAAGFQPAAKTAAGHHLRALILAGEGDCFCSGFDMKRVHEDDDALPTLLRGLSETIRVLRRMPIPVVIAAHGAAVAGGCALLGGGDLVVTDRAARLGYPVVKLGLSPAVTTPVLAQSLHWGGCRERALDPGLITGEEALRVGLAHVCCDLREDVIPKATRLAKHLTDKPALALAATKQLLNEIEGLDDAVLDDALAASLSIAGGADQRARVAALWKQP